MKKQFPDVIFRAVDIYDHKDIRTQLDVKQVPTYKVWVNGVLSNTVTGTSKNLLKQYVQDSLTTYEETHGN